MKSQRLRDTAQAIGLAGSVVCLLSGLWVAHFYLNQASRVLFWLSLMVTIVFATLSLPRWKSFAALTIIVLSLLWTGGRAFAVYHSSSPSPDGKYRLVTYRIPMLFAFPGQASDAAGYVQLQDKSGKILNEGYVEMVQIAYEPDWRTGEVQIGRGDGSYAWNLPQ